MDGLKKVVSFSLWGEDSKYTQGALENVRIAAQVFPGWVCRFYVGTSVPQEIVAQLREAPNAEVVDMGVPGDLRGAHWRIQSQAGDDVVLIRDVDCRLSRSEKEIVDAWLASGEEGWMYCDQIPLKTVPGCMFALRGAALPMSMAQLQAWEPKAVREDEEEFLRQRVVPPLQERGQMYLYDDTWGYGRHLPRLPEARGQEVTPFARIWNDHGVFAQPVVSFFVRHRFSRRTPLRRAGAALSQAVGRLHGPAGRALAVLLWRRLYGQGGLVLRARNRMVRGYKRRVYGPAETLRERVLAALPQVPAPERGVIAFALASDESEAPADAEGAVWNARAAAAFYPGWICRFHVGKAVSAQLRERLAALPNAEVAEVGEDGEAGDPRWWGLQAAGDCDVLLLRSVRARLTLMEKQAVWHWLASDRDIHSLHDHPEHRWEQPPAHLAGLRGGALRWLAEHRTQAQAAGDPLRALVEAMPRAWLQHDSHWGVGTPLPWPRILPRRMYHGMPWEPHPDFAGLPVPAWEPYRQRQRARHSPRFFAAMLARLLLRPLPERAARACMAGLCRLLYGRR